MKLATFAIGYTTQRQGLGEEFVVNNAKIMSATTRFFNAD
jgi:hypothetical protein